MADLRPRTYPSDMSDAEWDLIRPHLPPPKSGGPQGGRPAAPAREVVDAIFYLLRSGCAWRMLPADFPHWRTVYGYFKAWTDDGTLDRLHDALRTQVRAADGDEGRDPEPSAAILDGQSIRGADTVGTATRGYDAGKKTNGRKRHAIVDTIGMLLIVSVTAASIQDRDGAKAVLTDLHTKHPKVRHVWADGGYAGKLVTWAQTTLGINLEIVRKTPGQIGFAVLPRRWVVERTFGWLTKCRRLNADYERTPAAAQAHIKWAMIGLMSRRLARQANPTGNDVTPYNWPTKPTPNYA